MRELTDEELARAVQLDPSQIAGLGPSLEALMEMLRERKRKILATYETDAGASRRPASRFHDLAKSMQPPPKLAERFRQAVKRGAALRPGAALVSRRRRARAPSPGSCCS